MSEALRKPDSVPQSLQSMPLADLLPPVVPAGNDNEREPAPRVGERRGFEIPASFWRTMVACYAIFLAALLGATGGARAAFAIAISAVYVAMFFGTARVMLKHAPAAARSPLDEPGGKLATLYGPLNRVEVAAQMLVAPAAVALFGVAVLVIRLVVG